MTNDTAQWSSGFELTEMLPCLASPLTCLCPLSCGLSLRATPTRVLCPCARSTARRCVAAASSREGREEAESELPDSERLPPPPPREDSAMPPPSTDQVRRAGS